MPRPLSLNQKIQKALKLDAKIELLESQLKPIKEELKKYAVDHSINVFTTKEEGAIVVQRKRTKCFDCKIIANLLREEEKDPIDFVKFNIEQTEKVLGPKLNSAITSVKETIALIFYHK